jgi:hypothetical protein
MAAGQGAPRQQVTPAILALTPDDVAAQASCSAVVELFEGQLQQGMAIHKYAWSKALDHMKVVCRQPAQPPAEDMAAVGRLLALATEQLARLNARSLAAFMRCAAAFKGTLQPASLAAWQEVLSQPGKAQELNPQGVSNALLSLGTLADSDPQLAAAVERPLAEQLLQHAVDVLGGEDGNDPRQVGNALYGAVLLGLQPSRGQMEALFGVAKRVAQGLHYISLTQLLLACQKLMEQGGQLRQQRGLEAPSPSQNPYRMYYPGDDLMDKLLDRALQLARCGMSTQAASQILGACGALGFLPAPAALEGLLAGEEPMLHICGIRL